MFVCIIFKMEQYLEVVDKTIISNHFYIPINNYDHIITINIMVDMNNSFKVVVCYNIKKEGDHINDNTIFDIKVLEVELGGELVELFGYIHHGLVMAVFDIINNFIKTYFFY